MVDILPRDADLRPRWLQVIAIGDEVHVLLAVQAPLDPVEGGRPPLARRRAPATKSWLT